MATESKTSGREGFHLGRFLRNAAIIVAVVAVAIYAWEEHLGERLIPKNFGVVEDGAIYRAGNLSAPMYEKVVEERGVRTVIDFGGYLDYPETFDRIKALDERLGVERFLLPVGGDATGDPNRYVEALRIMGDESRGPFLVHCAAGAQRTGMCILLHRVINEGWTVAEAYEETRSYGHDPGKNWKFMHFLGTWRDEIERSLETGEPIDYRPRRPAPPSPPETTADAAPDGGDAPDAPE